MVCAVVPSDCFATVGQSKVLVAVSAGYYKVVGVGREVGRSSAACRVGPVEVPVGCAAALGLVTWETPMAVNASRSNVDAPNWGFTGGVARRGRELHVEAFREFDGRQEAHVARVPVSRPHGQRGGPERGGAGPGAHCGDGQRQHHPCRDRVGTEALSRRSGPPGRSRSSASSPALVPIHSMS